MLKDSEQEEEAADRRKFSKKSNEPSATFYQFWEERWEEKKDAIEETLENEERAEIDAMIGRFPFSSLLPFNAARNPSWIDSMKSLANFTLPGYVPRSQRKQELCFL